VSAPAKADPLVADIAGFTHDPLGFVLYAFPWGQPGELKDEAGPRAWQAETLREIGAKLRAGTLTPEDAIQLAVASGHGIGKSALVSWLILWALATCEDTRGVVTANTDTQLRTKTWPELAKWHRLSIIRHWFDFTATALSSTAPGHDKTWRIDAVPWSENNTEAFAGLHNVGKRLILIFDEASAIADKIWEVAEGALTDANTEIIWACFGNPTRNTGRFKDCFGRLKHRWLVRQIDSRTVEGTNKALLDKQVEDYGEDSDFVKARIRGIFPSASLRQFISQTDIDAAYGKHLPPSQYNYAAKILTCDPAFEGDDELVIGLRQGLAFRILRTIPKNDNDVVIANLLANLEDEHEADAVFVDAGYGTGIVSVGRTMGRDWMLVWFAGQSSDIGCANKRAEMWKLTRDWLKEGGAIPPDPVLAADLAGPELIARLDGKFQLESKKDMKKRGLPSPGRGDALALSFAFPVAAKGTRSVTRQATGGDYDPYARPSAATARASGGDYNPYA
jgi:hypothetical protein